MKGWDNNVSRGTTGDLAWDSQFNAALKYLDEQFAAGKLSRDEMKAFGAQHQMKPLSLADVREYLSFRDAQAPMDSRKRPRAGAYNSLRAKKAYWAQRRFGSVAPWSTHGAIRVKRGTWGNVAQFGPTYWKANKAQRAARKAHGYTGRGRYGIFGKAYRLASNPRFQKGFKRGVGYGADALTALTPLVPELAPAAAAAQGISGIMGRGRYATRGKVSKNQLFAGGARNTPVMRSAGYDGSLIVSHRELVQEIYGAKSSGTVNGVAQPSGFDVMTLVVNPGLERVFPWLSQLAANFEEYEIMQCVFEYQGRKMVGTTDELTIHGTVIAAHRFNFKAQEFQDKHEMQSYPHANSCQAHSKLIHGVEADPGKIVGDGHKFIRLGGLQATDDQRDFDHSTFSLAQSNIPGELEDKEIGSLYVSYTIKLMKPKLAAQRGLGIKSFRAVCAPAVALTTGVTPNVLGTLYDERADGTTTSLAPVARNTLDIGVERLTTDGVLDSHFVFPPNASGTYKVTIALESIAGIIHATSPNYNTAEGSTLPVKLFGQLVTVPMMFAAGSTTASGSSAFRISGAVSGDSNRATLEFIVKVRPQVGSQKNMFRLDDFGDSGTVSQSYIDITEYNTFGEDVPVVGR